MRYSKIPAAVAVCVAAIVFLLLPTEFAPLRLVSLFAGESVRAVDIHGGSVVELRADSAEGGAAERAADELRARLERTSQGVSVDATGDRLFVAVFETPPQEAKRLVGQLTGTSALQITPVVRDAPFMQDLALRVVRERRSGSTDVDVARDGWSHDSRGRADTFLTAESLEALEAFVRTVTPEPGRALLIEADGQNRPRTYYVEANPALTGADIAHAQVVWNPTTGMPEVLVTFTEAGGQKLADVTGAHLGEKLAIVVNEGIVSAPVIQAAVTGGQVTITGGYMPAREAEAWASGLAATLGMEPMSVPVSFVAVAHNPARVGSTPLWLATGTVALGLGLLAFGLTLLVVRWVTPTPAIAEARTLDHAGPTARRPWLRLLVTLAGPVFVVASARVLLAGLDPAAVEDLIVGFGDVPVWSQATAQLSVFALGLTPVLSGFVLVELAALAVPRWRGHRHEPVGRSRLAVASLALGIVLAFVQGLFIAIWLEGVGRGAAGFVTMELVPDPGWAFRTLTMLSLAGGTLVFVVVAWLVGRYGLGNGFSVLLATGLLLGAAQTFRTLRAMPHPPMVVLSLVVVLGGVALATAWVLRARAANRRLPAGGVVPLAWGSSVVMLVSSLAMVGVAIPAGWLELLAPESLSALVVLGVFVVAFGAACSWLFSRVPPLHPANVWSTAYLLALATATFVLVRYAPAAYLDVMTVALGTAVGLDLYDEWRARRRHPDLVFVCDEHRVQRADQLVEGLRAAGIPALSRGANHRALMHFFGPFVPISILVPREHADRAAQVCTDTPG